MYAGSHEIIEQQYARTEKYNTFHCFERNDAEACHELADFLEKKKKKYKDAFDIYKNNCLKNQYGHSCFQYGQFLYHGRGVEKDVGEAFKAHLKGCDVKNYSGASCDTVAGLYIKDKVEPEVKAIRGEMDKKKAVKLYQKGCDGNDGLACLHSALVFRKGIKDVMKEDPKLAFKYALKACELNVKEGCHFVAESYKDGFGVEKNEKLYDFYRKQRDQLAQQANLTL